MAFVQDDFGTAVADAGTVAFGSNVTANNGLFAIITFGDATTVVNGITDTLGNTWAVAESNHANSRGVEIWYAHSPTGGANTCTFDWSAAVNAQVIISEFSAFTNGVSLGEHADGANDTTSPQLAGTVTTTHAVGVAIAALRTVTAYSLTSWDESFTAFTSTTNRTLGAYLVTSSTGTLGPEATMAANEDTIGAVAHFYETPAGGGSVVPVLMREYRARRGA